MGRKKPVPKRRRIEEEESQKSAIETLQKQPISVLEAAAADAFRADIATWNRLDDTLLPNANEIAVESKSAEISSKSTSKQEEPTSLPPPNPFHGLGRSKIESESDFETITKLHNLIKSRASQNGSMTSWSGSQTDSRKRAFGFLPETLGFKPNTRKLLDITTPDARVEDAMEEIKRNERAMVMLTSDDDVSVDDVKKAFERLLSKLRPHAPEPLRKYISYENLIAAQPNLHCGRHLLPMHVDHPSKDGFGIVIVTIAVCGDSEILLESHDRSKRGVFKLSKGEAYILSGNVRNMCRHGVLADLESGGRESLNLRFGLHGKVEGVDPTEEDVMKYWTEGAAADGGYR